MVGKKLSRVYGQVVGAFVAGAVLVATPVSGIGPFCAAQTACAAVPAQQPARRPAARIVKAGAKGTQKQAVALKAQRARKGGGEGQPGPRQHDASLAPRECVKESQPNLKVPLLGGSGEGIDVAALKAACQKKNARADLSDRLGKAPADGTAVAERKAPEKDNRVTATIGAYEGRLSQKEFSVNIGSTFR